MAKFLLSISLLFVVSLTVGSFFLRPVVTEVSKKENSFLLSTLNVAIQSSHIAVLPKNTLAFISPLFIDTFHITSDLGKVFEESLRISLYGIYTTGRGVTVFVSHTVESADNLGVSVGQITASVIKSKNEKLPEYKYAIKRETEEIPKENIGFVIGKNLLGEIKSAKESLMQKISNTFEPLAE